MDYAIAPAILAAIGTGIGYLFNKKANKDSAEANQQFWDYTHGIERSEAIADRDFMNNYNSPEEQMRRYKEAGLNPNLIYGQQNNMPAVRSSGGTQGTMAPTRIDPSQIGELVNQQYNVMETKQSISNMEKQAEVMESVKNLNNAKAISEGIRPGWLSSQIGNIDSKTNLNKQALEQQNELFPTQLSAQQLLVGKIKQEIATSKSQQSRNEASTQTENKLRQLKYDLMKAQVELNKANKEGNYQKIRESEQRVLNLKKEYNAVEINLGLLGKYGFKLKEGQNIHDVYEEIKDSY